MRIHQNVKKKVFFSNYDKILPSNIQGRTVYQISIPNGKKSDTLKYDNFVVFYETLQKIYVRYIFNIIVVQ